MVVLVVKPDGGGAILSWSLFMRNLPIWTIVTTSTTSIVSRNESAQRVAYACSGTSGTADAQPRYRSTLEHRGQFGILSGNYAVMRLPS